jgi:hypothetical protein
MLVKYNRNLQIFTVHAVSRWLHIILSVHTALIQICNCYNYYYYYMVHLSFPPNMTWDRRTFDQLMEVFQYTQWQDTNSQQCSKQELKLENEGTFHKRNCSQYRTNIQQMLICGTYGSTSEFILGLCTAEAAAADCSESWMTYCIKCYWVKWEKEARRTDYKESEEGGLGR